MPFLVVFTLYKMLYKEDMINPKRILSRYQVEPVFQGDQKGRALSGPSRHDLSVSMKGRKSDSQFPCFQDRDNQLFLSSELKVTEVSSLQTF